MRFVSALPSPVRSSIAFTSMARGNVAGAVVAAAASNLLGIVLTPFIVMLLSEATGASVSLAGVGRIALLLLAPFVLGQLPRRWLADWVANTRRNPQFTERRTSSLPV